MKKPRFSRREFLGGAAAAAALPAGGAQEKYTTVVLSSGSALPVETAAAELAKKTGAGVERRDRVGPVGKGEIVLALGEEIRAQEEAAAMLPAGGEWEIVKRSGEGLVIAGSSPRNVCHAALAWVENPEGETDRVSKFDFTERFTMWDNSLNQWYRFSKGFERKQYIREVARLGHTGVEINRYADAEGFWVRHRKFPEDSYAWYMSYAPALDAFVETSLTEGLYPKDELERNLADLREALEIARRYGLAPGFVCYEPRGVSEKVFDRYPGLRGSRIDHPGRSLEPRYSLDIANRRVLEHYAEAITNLMKTVPELRYFVFWTEDSGSGIPFTTGLYFGPNGSYRARSSTIGKMVADFSGTLLEAGKKVNPDFEVIMEMGWEYRDHERREITAALPKGVTLSHHLGGRLLSGGEAGAAERYTKESRAAGVEPYATVSMTTTWEPEPIIGIVRPSVLVKKFGHLRRLGLKRIFTNGGIASPPQCPYQISQELYAELIRGEVTDLDAFYQATARRWCKGDERAAAVLVRAWKTGDEAFGKRPELNWYHAGSGQTQGRWITRPLVPDITLLDERERAAWERELFTLPWDVGRPNIVFEGGIRMYTEEQLENAIQAYDEEYLPRLAATVASLDHAPAELPVIVDQRDRYHGMLLRERTVRNLFDAQVAINYWLLGQGDKKKQRLRLTRAIHAEIANTGDWLQHLKQSKTNFFRVTERRETPFLYKTPVADLELKLAVMRAHIGDQPGPDLEELREPLSERRLLYYN